MSVQFRLGRNDHRVTEDFLSRTPRATSAITLDPKAARYQAAAAEAARDHGISVFVEPCTERLTDAGFGLDAYPMWAGAPYNTDALAADPRLRLDLVARTIAAHPDVATHITAPHFFVDNDRSARLNVDLAEMTLIQAGKPVRAVLTISNKYAGAHAAELASEYASAGITVLELRLSPFGGEDESLKKIRDGFATAQAFTDAGLSVTLGQSGNLGQVAVALGHVEAYSVGIGLLVESVNHASVVSRQKTPPKPRSKDEPGGGPVPGIYLNGIALTAPPRVAKLLLGHSDLRIRVGCREGRCGTSVRGPLVDTRDHYLHSRDSHMGRLLDQPKGWRPTSEIDRLRAAFSLREHINTNYLGSEALELPALKTRTLSSLISDIESVRSAS